MPSRFELSGRTPQVAGAAHNVVRSTPATEKQLLAAIHDKLSTVHAKVSTVHDTVHNKMSTFANEVSRPKLQVPCIVLSF